MKSFDEILEERKRKKENGGIEYSRFDAAMKNRASKKASELYESFFNEVSGFSSQAEKDYNSINYGNAGSMYDKYASQTSNYKEKATSLKNYLKDNKDYLDSESYQKMLDNVRSYDDFLTGTFSAFGEHRDYYSQWDTEDDYNSYIASQKEYEELKTLDLDVLKKDVDYYKTQSDNVNDLRSKVHDLDREINALELSSNFSAEARSQLEEKKKKRETWGQMLEAAEAEGWDTKWSESNAKYNNANRIQSSIKLTEDALKADDFEEKSGYVSTHVDKSELGFWDRFVTQPIDTTYEYINGVDGAREDIKHKHNVYSSDNPFDDGESTWEEKAYDYITDEEKKIYNYYYSTGGAEKANEYLDSIQETLYQRKASARFENLEDKTFAELAFGVYAGLDQFTTGFENLFNTTDDYIPVNDVQQTSGMVREDLKDDSFNLWYNFKTGEWEDKVFGSSLGQVGYDSITTTSNMLPSILTSAAANMIAPGSGEIVGTALMGGSAAGNAYQEMLNLGYDKKQARSYAAMVGASEAGLQYLLGGIGKLGGKVSNGVISKMVSGIDNAFARTAIKLGGNMLSEGLEESLQEVLTPFFKNIALYENNDLSDVDWSQVAYSGLLGALSAGILEGGSTISEGVNTYKTGKAVKDAGQVSNLVNLGKSMSADTVAYELAGKVNENTGAYTIGTLLHEVGADSLSETNLADITSTLESRGVAPEYSKVIAKWLNKAVGGETLTKTQQMALEYNEDIGEVIRDVIINKNSTVNQRLQGYKSIVNTTQFNEGIKQLRKQAEKIEKKNAKSGKNTEAKVETTVENHFDVSEDGKTVNKTTEEAINVAEISSIKDGKMTLKLDTGETVDANDVGFASNDEGVLYSGVLDMGVNAEVANQIVKNFDSEGGLSAQQYILGVQEAYRYGKYNIPVNEMSGKTFSADLNVAQRTHAYNLGKSDARAEASARQKAIDEAVKNANTKNGEKGKVHFKGNRSTLTELQKTSLKTLDKLSEVLGVNFYIYESRVENGKRVYTDIDGKVKPAPNGKYYKDGSIHIDLNAGSDGKGTILFTAAHELTHYIKQWSPAKFKVLADFLMEQYGKANISVDTLVKQQISKAKRNGRDIDYDTAYEEVVADSMESMLTDGKVAEKLALLKTKDKGLWNKIKQFFAELAAKIREVYKGLDPESREGRYVAEMKDAIDRIQELFTEALADASENYNSIGSRNLNDFSEAKTTSGESLFQYRAMEADESIYREMLKTANIMSDTEIDNLFETINSAVDIIKDNLEALDFAWDADIDDRAFSPVKPNSDSLYQVSVDFSTLCRKRLLQQAIQVQLQEALNKPLTREEGIAIRDALMAIQEEGRQIEIACALCYVESARMKSPAQIKKFLNNRESVIKDFFASKSDEVKAEMKKAEADVRKKLGVGNKSLKSLPGKTAKVIRDAKKAVKANYTPTATEQAIIETAKGMSVTDFTSPEGLENLAKNHKDLFDAYTSYIRNATKSKGIEADTWWRAGDSASISDTLIANMNAENGLRSQSWSDFQVIHLLDYIAATIELSTRKAKMQVYSKVADYVELMGNTGQMINISLIPSREFSGSLDYDSTEGMEYKKALELRNKYHATAGTICIGINNTQIQMLLADGNIDYVIPYHRSGMAKSIRKAMHIPTWSEYENYQSESELDRKSAEEQAKKYGVKLLDESDPNYHKHSTFSEWFDLKVAQQIAKMENATPSNKEMQKKYGVMYGGYMAMQNAADTYLKLCAERGIAPKFSNENANFTAEDNYWKLLIDRKMVDNVTGEIIEQQAVKPVFDQSEVLRILNDELERYPGVKADQEYATRKVVQGFLSGNVKGGMSSQAIAKVMQTPVDNVTKTNILAAEDDTKYSDREYSYNALISKPDMPIATITGNVLTNRADIVAVAKRNAAKVGKANQDGSISVHVNDIDTDVILTTHGLRHGLRRKQQLTKANGIVTLMAGEIIQNSIRVNELVPADDAASSTYILMGIARDTNGDVYIVRSVINRYANELVSMDALYAVNAKKELAVQNAPRLTAKPLSVTSSAISIADYLDYVNQYFPSVLPEDVLKHYNHTERPDGDLAEDILYQDRDPDAVSNRTLLANALESTIDTSTQEGQNELRKLNEYKEMVNTLDEWNAKLTDLRSQLFNKGTDGAKRRQIQDEATKLANRISIYDKKLLTLEASKPLKAVLDREKAKAVKRQKQKDAEVIKAYRDTAEAKLKQQAQHYQESRKNAVDSRRKTAMKQSIKRVVNRLNSLLNNGTKERNVKAGLQDTVASTLAAVELLFESNITNDDIVRNGIDFATEEDSIRLNRYSDLLEQRDSIIGQIDAIVKASGVSNTSGKTEALYAKIDRIDAEISKLGKELAKVFEMERARINRATVSSAIDSIENAYESIKTSEDDYIKNSYDEFVAVRLASLKESAKGTLIRDMTIAQLTELHDAVTAIAHTVSTANKLFREGKSADLVKFVSAVQQEISEYIKEGKKDPRAFVKFFNDKFNDFRWNELKPVEAFEKLGSDTFKKLFWDVIKAEGVWAKDMEEAKSFLDEQREKYGYKSWDMESSKTFYLQHGQKFKLTLQDMMSIYAYSKREQADEHMTVGGFQFAENSEYKDEKDEKGNKVKRVHLTGDLYKADWTTITRIVAELGKVDNGNVIKYVDAVQEYLTKMGEKGNEVSNVLYGIDLFKEKAYFPLMSAKDYISSVQETLNNTQTMVSLKNTGMTKQTVPHAKNPIILQGFDSVVEAHIDKMSKYHALVLPIENLRRVFDSSSLDAITEEYVSTKAIVNKAFGTSAEKYFNQYITDLNGGTFVDGAKSPLMAMFSKFKATAVGASLSVVVQQPMAITRAMAMIDPKHFVVGETGKAETKKLYDEIKKYAPVAIIKEMGGFEIGSGRTGTEYLRTRTDKGIKRVMDEVNDKSMLLAGKADELGWNTIWLAVKREVNASKKYKFGSKEFYEACGERFTEVIVRTQVYDSVNSRSGYMRAKSDLVKFATSFMGEPTTVINMAYDAVLKVSRAKTKAERVQAMKNLGRTTGVLVVSNLLTIIAKSFVYAMWDDDDDEAFLEKWAKHTGDNLGLWGDLNPLTMLPYVKDIVALFEGYDVERPDMTLIANAISSLTKMLDGKSDGDGFTDTDEVLSAIGDVANIFGVPVKNVIRDAKGIYNFFEDIFDDVSPTDMGGAFAAGISNKDYTEKTRVENAFKKGDTAEVKRIIDKMVEEKTAAIVESGEKEADAKKQAKSRVRSSYTSTYKKLYLEAYEKKDIDEMNRIRKLLYATGLYGFLWELDETLSDWKKKD